MAQPPKFRDDLAMIQAAQDLLDMRETRGWKILMAQLKKEHDAAFEEFVDIDTMNLIRVEELQREIRFYRWMRDRSDTLIAQGLQIDEAREAGDEGDEDNG